LEKVVAGTYHALAMPLEMTVTEQGGMWIGSIVIDCTNLDKMISFWTEALHYVPRDPPESDGAVLKDPKGKDPNLNLSLSGEGPLEEYRPGWSPVRWRWHGFANTPRGRQGNMVP
jgi:hypothetical protein